MVPREPEPNVDVFGWVGELIEGKYRVERVVGEGGFGVVYAGRHVAFDEPIAIKCLKLASLPDDRREMFLDAFRAEGKIMFRLSQSSPAIVRAIDLGAAVSPNGSWTPYLVLEWVEGWSLEADLARRASLGLPPRSVGEALQLLEPALRGLDAAHRERVAHRDIKPANLVITDVGGAPTMKLLDFGVAKVMSHSSVAAGEMSTAPGVRAFSAAYAAPEQLATRYGATGPWTDVFALGLVIVEVVIGRRPIEGDDLHAVFAQIVDPAARPTPRRFGVAVPDAVERVLARALAVDPRERFASAGELWDALADAVGLAPEVGAMPRRSFTGVVASAPPVALADTAPAETRPLPVAESASATAASAAVASAPRASAVASPPRPPKREQRRPSSSLARSDRLVYAAVLAVAVAALAFVAFYKLARSNPTPAADPAPATPSMSARASPSSPPTSARAAAPSSPEAHKDARRAVLAAEDAEHVGSWDAWRWSNRCFEHLQAGDFGWAKAACDEAEVAGPDDKTLPLLRYNQGRVAREAGDVDRARRLFTESLRLRENKTVRRDLEGLR